MTADLVVRGGTVVDGSGRPGVQADVAVENGRISAVGKNLEGKQTLDASGHVVAPGFIDIHTHYDAQVFWDPALSPSCYHGVTTVVAGNCGFSIAPTRPDHRELIARTLENVEDMNVASLAAGIPWDFETFPEYLASVERRGTVLNFGAYIGHTALRLFVMGDDAYHRPAKEDEIARMAEVVGAAMEAGACGFASSFAVTHRGADGMPVPSRLAEPAEVEAILGAVAASRRGVISVAPGGDWSIDRFYEVQPRLGVPVTYGALLTSVTGRHHHLVELNRKGWESGAQVWPQVSPRPLKFQVSMASPFNFNVNPVFAELMASGMEERRTAYADAAWRQRATEAFAGQTALAPRWDTFSVDESPAHRDLEGMSISKLAAERGVSELDVVLDLALDEPDLAVRVGAIIANDDVDGVLGLLAEEHCTLGLSDAGAHVGQLCDAPQATDLLGNWVRDRSALTVEAAVRKLSGQQADIYGFADRGYIREGAWADMVVFDPDTVAPGPVRRVRDFPADAERLTADQPSGITHVVVNGTPIRRDGQTVTEVTERRPGQVVRPAVRR